MSINEIVATVSQIRCLKDGNRIANASGFFYVFNDELYAITNRHVVIDESKDYYPDSVQMLLHTSASDVRLNATYDIRLYDDANNRRWLEHPVGSGTVDVVAIPLDAEEIRSRYFVRGFDARNHVPSDLDMSIGEDVQVIGYPLGFHDSVHNLPIVRNATLASVYPVPFEGNPYILIDARLHSGTSGSPVVTKPTNVIRKTDGSVGFLNKAVSYLVGVHSASVDMLNRDPDRDEPLGLNVVWFASLIEDIVRGAARP
jgi:S1-C subfamily serine protease